MWTWTRALFFFFEAFSRGVQKSESVKVSSGVLKASGSSLMPLSQRESHRGDTALQKEEDVPFFCHSITLLSSGAAATLYCIMRAVLKVHIRYTAEHRDVLTGVLVLGKFKTLGMHLTAATAARYEYIKIIHARKGDLTDVCVSAFNT